MPPRQQAKTQICSAWGEPEKKGPFPNFPQIGILIPLISGLWGYHHHARDGSCGERGRAGVERGQKYVCGYVAYVCVGASWVMYV
jgi:hypothetical protein